MKSIWCVLALFAVSACASDLSSQLPTRPEIELDDPSPTPIIDSHSVGVWPTASPAPSPSALPSPSSAPLARLGPGEGIPIEVADAARTRLRQAGMPLIWAESGPFDLALELNSGQPVADWVYAVAAPFATTKDSTTWEEVRAGWETGVSPLGALVLDGSVLETFTILWGPPTQSPVVVGGDQLVGALWETRPSWTLLPFHRLRPELKVLQLDGQSPLEHGFDQLSYPLTVKVGVTGETRLLEQFMTIYGPPVSNRDASLMTRVAMTGVTALGRGTAYQMEIRGVTVPGEAVKPILGSADIAHISHEIPFAPDCPYPNPIGAPVFCARDDYLELIRTVGTDVVELTGNHVNDWGPHNLIHTIELYEAAGLQIFGGGRNLAEAQEPATFEHHSNKIAFLGCNPVGPAGAWATDTRPGARPCDYPNFLAQIRELRDSGYLVIATLQYSEFYQYAPTMQQQADFRALADAGAIAVSGSQGHHAQGFEFRNQALIHYGLGNLFFDQMQMLGTRQSFIDTYVIYDDRLIGVELFTSLLEDYCCPRQMATGEREQFLLTAFQASGW